MVQRLQSTFDTRLGVLQNLAQQTADQAKVTSAAVADLQQKLNAQNEGVGAKVDTVSGQVQSLNDSVDELKSRVAKLNKSVEDLQTQLQNIQSQPQPGRRRIMAQCPVARRPALRPRRGWNHSRTAGSHRADASAAGYLSERPPRL